MEYHVIGLMSGTSLDGLDIAACKFCYENGKWTFAIQDAETVAYTEPLQEKLRNAHTLSAYEYVLLHNELANYWGILVKQFIENQAIKVDFIASHGHTVFHQPQKGLTTQIGNGAILAAICQLPVVSDFRVLDVALGGQGAPLVPIGDKLLFGEYDFCLNLGGIANISTENNGQRIAYDICPANMILNHLALQLGYSYDENGNLARKGKFDKELFENLNQLDFYQQVAPKSLGREWFAEKFMPLINQYLHNTNHETIENLLATCTHHIAYQIAQNITSTKQEKPTLLVTGGGAFNSYLLELLQNYAPNLQIIVPDSRLIQFKEALIFAFLGVLRWRNEPNALKSVTGASKDSCGGSVFYHL